jgi:hypothetical protein
VATGLLANPINQGIPMPTIHRSMAPALSFNGGFVDTIGLSRCKGCSLRTSPATS